MGANKDGKKTVKNMLGMTKKDVYKTPDLSKAVAAAIDATDKAEALKVQEPKPEPILPTIISAGTVITGEICSAGDVAMHGSMKGDIEAKGNIAISGKIVGNLVGQSMELKACAIQGDIHAATSLHADGACVIIGDVIAADTIFNGKLKGNMTATGTAMFQRDALVVGDICAQAVSVEQGTKLRGSVKINDAEGSEQIFEVNAQR